MLEEYGREHGILNKLDQKSEKDINNLWYEQVIIPIQEKHERGIIT